MALALLLLYLATANAASSATVAVMGLLVGRADARPPSLGARAANQSTAAAVATAAVGMFAVRVIRVKAQVALKARGAHAAPRGAVVKSAPRRTTVPHDAPLTPNAPLSARPRGAPAVRWTTPSPVPTAAARGAALVQTSADSPYALRPADGGLYLKQMLDGVERYIERGVNANTKAGEDSAWQKYYLPYARLVGASPWRGFAAVSNPVGEAELTCGFAMHVWLHMQPRRRADPAPRVDSVRKVVGHVRRKHVRAGFAVPPWMMVAHFLKGLAMQRIADYGLALPVRAEPFTAAENVAMKALPQVVGKRVYSPTSRFWAGWRMVDTYGDQAGPRKSEVVGTADIRFMRADVQLIVDGVTYADPGPDEFAAVVSGRDTVTVAVNVSKADFDGSRFGNSLVSMTYNEDNPMSFAAAWIQYELLFPLRGFARRTTPLFTTDGTTPWTATQIDTTLADVMKATLTPAQRKGKTFHSKRVWVATALHALKSSTAEIQAFVRWASPESVTIYARMDLLYQAQRRDALQNANVTALNAVRRELIEPTEAECNALRDVEMTEEN